MGRRVPGTSRRTGAPRGPGGQVHRGCGLGGTDRLEFTVIGHTVNVASRIEGQAREPRPPLLFSEEVARRLGDSFRVAEADTVALKGVAGEVRLLTVAGDISSARLA